MRRTALVALVVLSAVAVAAPMLAGTFPSFCQYMPFFRDNLTVKADIPDGKLRIDKEGSFRVYLYNTMTPAFYDAKLDVLSEQFDTEVAPSPTWKTFPDILSATKGGTKEYFTVTLKRKNGVPDGQYDISLKLYSSRAKFRRLAAIMPIAEALDEHTVPLHAAIAVDGKVSPSEWADSLLVKDFLSYKAEGHSLRSHSPSAQTRIHMAADKDNLYLLVLFMGTSQGGDLKMYVAPDIESQPKVVTLDQTTGKITSGAPMDGALCVRCEADPRGNGAAALYELRIPRKALGVDRKNSFFADFCRSARVTADDPEPECSYWRGNDISVNEPVVYGKIVIEPAATAAAAPTPPAGTPAPSPAAAASSVATRPGKDNLIVKADLSESDLQFSGEKAFRVYVQSTLKAGLAGVALDVLSDRFDATVEPSPAWKGYPDLKPAAKEYFTVTLRRKRPGAGETPDLFLKLTSLQRQERQLLAFLPISEAIDQHVLPFCPAMTIDGKASPRKWADSLALTGFLPYKGNEWRSGTPGLTRLHLAADKDNLYLLAAFMSVSREGALKLSVAASVDSKPAWVAIDRATGRITSSAPTDGMECRKCEDDPLLITDPKDPFKVPSSTVYECRIPRKALGIDATESFLGNVESDGTYWRGNPVSAADPVSYGRFVFGK